MYNSARLAGQKLAHCLAHQKSDNLQYKMLGQWNDGMIVPLSDGPMIIFIDWE